MSRPAPVLRNAPLPSRSNAIFRAAAAVLRGNATGQSPDVAARKMFGREHGLDVVLRAASAMATTTGTGWADVLGRNVVRSDLMQKITGLSAAAALMEAGIKVDLAGNASVTIPARSYNPANAGAWVAEGAPIPVRAIGVLGGPKLVPRKLAVITPFTAEMVMADSIEQFCQAAISEAAAAVLDTKMFSTDPADATAPAGILAGATTVTASAGGPWPMASDIGLLIAALAAHGAGLEPVIIASPAQATAIRMWRAEFPVFASLALPAGTVVAVEASSFVSGLDGLPTFSTTTGATLHMEDTAPGDISGSTPVKSLYQTDVVGLKMILRANWAMRNPAHVAVMHSVSW